MIPALDEMAVELDESGGIELLPGSAERAFCDDTFGHIARAQDLKELIQLALERALDQVDQEHDHDGKRQGAVAGKVCFGASVPGNEGRIVDQITQRLNKATLDTEGFPRSCPDHYLASRTYQPLAM